MKIFLLTFILGLILQCSDTFAASGRAVHVKGYTRKDGTYVAPHYRSAPNSTKADNWSTKGNVNPYTGQAGTRSMYSGGGGYVRPIDTSIHENTDSFPLQNPIILNAPTVSEPHARNTNTYQLLQSSGLYDERQVLLQFQQQHADKGNPESQYSMAIRYLNGIDVPKDDQKALEYLRSAKKAGNLRASAKLAEMRTETRKAKEAAAIKADQEFLKLRASEIPAVAEAEPLPTGIGK